MNGDAVIDAIDKKEGQLLRQLARLRAAKEAYLTGRQREKRASGPTVPDMVLTLLPTDGSSVSLLDCYNAGVERGLVIPKASVAAALSILKKRGLAVQPAYARYARVHTAQNTETVQ